MRVRWFMAGLLLLSVSCVMNAPRVGSSGMSSPASEVSPWGVVEPADWTQSMGGELPGTYPEVHLDPSCRGTFEAMRIRDVPFLVCVSPSEAASLANRLSVLAGSEPFYADRPLRRFKLCRRHGTQTGALRLPTREEVVSLSEAARRLDAEDCESSTSGLCEVRELLGKAPSAQIWSSQDNCAVGALRSPLGSADQSAKMYETLWRYPDVFVVLVREAG